MKHLSRIGGAIAACIILLAGSAEAQSFGDGAMEVNGDVGVVGSSGNKVAVTPDGQMHVVLQGTVDDGNSTTNLLGAGGVFMGDAKDISNYAAIAVHISSDVASATKGLNILYSPDNVTWHVGESYTISAGTSKFYTPPAWLKYYRVLYTNGVTPQATFHIYAQLHKTIIKPSSHNVNEPIADEDDAELGIVVVTAKDPSGDYANLERTADGNLKVANVASGLEIVLGNVEGREVEHKFGAAPNFDQADGEVTIWDGAEDNVAWENMRYNYSAIADIDSISSTDNSDTQEILVRGLDALTNIIDQTVTLVGTQRVALATNMYRVFRVYNNNSTDFTGHILVYTNQAVTAGIPADPEGIRAIIQPGNGQTEMALYTVAAGRSLAIRRVYAYTAGAKKTAVYVVKLYSREPGKVFRLRFHGAMSDDSAPIVHPYDDPLVFIAGTDLEMTVEIPDGTSTDATITGGFSGVLVDD